MSSERVEWVVRWVSCRRERGGRELDLDLELELELLCAPCFVPHVP